ncbi:MAG: glycoside hydrolase, partial [Spirochaetaceae bacterium]|nr:glycoside hydrolase [Spirochaetaceae bacterium]
MATLAALVLAAGNVFAQADFYWDSPEQFSPAAGIFPQAASGGGVAAVAWQETARQETARQDGQDAVFVSVAVSAPAHADPARAEFAAGPVRWSIHRRVAGAYPYSGAAPWLYSLFVDDAGVIFLPVAASTASTELYISRDRGASFSVVVLNSGEDGGQGAERESVAPRIFQTASGGYLLFTGRSVNSALTLYYARSADGVNWSPFSLFAQNDPALTLNFLPAHVSFAGCEYVVFQSYIKGEAGRLSFQLYLKISADGGKTWSAARRVTNFRDPVSNTTENPDFFNNERPHIGAYGSSLFLVWERKYISGTTSIYALRLGRDGEALGRAEKINQQNAVCLSPVSVESGGTLFVLWFDNRAGNNAVVMARRNGAVWEERVISGGTTPAGGTAPAGTAPAGTAHSAMFASPTLAAGTLYVFWQDSAGGESRVYYREQDTRAAPPALRAVNFTPGLPTQASLARIAWREPPDPSGIRGYSWLWSRDADAVPPRTLRAGAGVTQAEFQADRDGSWYFTICAADYAGNWSPPETLRFIRDTTPPDVPVIERQAADADGFLFSNTFTLRW